MVEAAGAVNVYRCPKGHGTVTRNRNEGTTPFMLRCRTDGCAEMAQSSFYRVPQDQVAAFEWIAPTNDELERYLAGAREEFLTFVRANPQRSMRWADARADIMNHVRQGGLLLRAVNGGRVGPSTAPPMRWA